MYIPHLKKFQCLFDMLYLFIYLGALASQVAPGVSYILPAPTLGSTPSPRSSGSFHWMMVLRNHMTAFIIIRISPLLGPISGQSRKCMYVY